MDKVTVAGTFLGGTGVPRVLVDDVSFTTVPARHPWCWCLQA